MKNIDDMKEISDVLKSLEEMILELKVDTQTIFNILTEEDICDEDDINDMRRRVKNMPKYKEMYEELGIEVEPLKKKKEEPDFDKMDSAEFLLWLLGLLA